MYTYIYTKYTDLELDQHGGGLREVRPQQRERLVPLGLGRSRGEDDPLLEESGREAWSVILGRVEGSERQSCVTWCRVGVYIYVYTIYIYIYIDGPSGPKSTRRTLGGGA